MVEFTDHNDLEAWLEKRPWRVSIAIAHRSAVRSAPFYLDFQDYDSEKKWASTLRLAGLRAILTSGVAARCSTPKVTEELQHAFFSFSSSASSTSAVTAARSAAYSALSAATASTSAFSSASAASSSSSAASSLSSDTDMLRDVSEATTTEKIAALFLAPAWSGPVPQDVQTALVNFLATAQTPDSPWAFWADWFEGAWSGQQKFPREMLEEIALIPDADWGTKDPAHIAKIIEGIRAPYRLREQIRDLKAELARQEGDPPPMGHNMPPEDRIADATPQQATTIIWATVSEIEEELEKDTPDVKKLGGLMARIKMLAAKAGQFASDMAYDGAKVVAGGVIATNWPAVQTALEKMTLTMGDWISYLVSLIG